MKRERFEVLPPSKAGLQRMAQMFEESKRAHRETLDSIARLRAILDQGPALKPEGGRLQYLSSEEIEILQAGLDAIEAQRAADIEALDAGAAECKRAAGAGA